MKPDTQPRTATESEPKRGGKMVWAAIAAAVAFMVLAVIFAGRFGGTERSGRLGDFQCLCEGYAGRWRYVERAD